MQIEKYLSTVKGSKLVDNENEIILTLNKDKWCVLTKNRTKEFDNFDEAFCVFYERNIDHLERLEAIKTVCLKAMKAEDWESFASHERNLNRTFNEMIFKDQLQDNELKLASQIVKSINDLAAPRY